MIAQTFSNKEILNKSKTENIWKWNNWMIFNQCRENAKHVIMQSFSRGNIEPMQAWTYIEMKWWENIYLTLWKLYSVIMQSLSTEEILNATIQIKSSHWNIERAQTENRKEALFKDSICTSPFYSFMYCAYLWHWDGVLIFAFGIWDLHICMIGIFIAKT